MGRSEFVRSALVWAIQQGGTLASDDHGKARIEVCKTRRGGEPCEFAGEVQVAGLKFEGCTNCGCPFATKPYMLELKVPVHKEVKCPHPEGNFWARVDSKFLKSTP